MQTHITIDDRAATAAIQRVHDAVGPAGRARLHEAAALTLAADIRAHILDRAAPARHRTAAALGAQPTGHLEAAADSVAHTANAQTGAVTIDSPGFRRVFGPLTIRPRRARALTIAVDALSYGRTVAEVRREHYLFRPRGKDYLATTEGRGDSARLRVLYLLRQSVTLPQDRGLLPTDPQLTNAARRGMIALLQALTPNP